MDSVDPIRVWVGDITEYQGDAIVNAANSSLLGGGGVDGAIHRAGGAAILSECQKIREECLPKGLPPGDAITTSAGNLKVKWIIHTVGPVWQGGKNCEQEVLARAYWNSLSEAVKIGAINIAFPAISTGIYSYPMELAAEVAVTTVTNFLNSSKASLNILFALFSEREKEQFCAGIDPKIASQICH